MFGKTSLASSVSLVLHFGLQRLVTATPARTIIWFVFERTHRYTRKKMLSHIGTDGRVFWFARDLVPEKF